MTLFDKNDRIPVKIGDVTFWVAPLNQNEKAELATAIGFDSGEKVTDMNKLYRCCVKHCVKRVDGVTRPNGTKYAAKLDNKGNLTDKAVDDIMMLGCSSQLARAASILWSEVKEVDIEGVTVDIKGTMPEKKLESLSL